MKIYKKGRFSGRYDTSGNVSFLKILKWKLLGKKRAASVKKKQHSGEIIYRPDLISQKDDFICWLSHASFLIQLGGKRIVIDPVFGDIPFYRRMIRAPYSVDELGSIDFLLLSHVHYDHFDTKSLRLLETKSPKAIVPLGMSELLRRKVPSIKSRELDWYQSYEEDGLSITLVPAKHWGRRTLFDKNRALWGGFILRYGDRCIYFAGDTASGDHFEAIGRQFAIDYALLPTGAYEPEFIMKYNHLSPEEAFEAFVQLKAKKMIPMHYGTFMLSDEPPDEPLERMRKIAKRYPDKICFLKAGETLIL